MQEGQQDSQSWSSIRNNPTRTPKHCIQGDLSSSTTQSTPTTQSSGESRPRNTRSLREIYEDLYVNSNIALFTCQLTSFEEAMTNENWVK